MDTFLNLVFIVFIVFIFLVGRLDQLFFVEYKALSPRISMNHNLNTFNAEICKIWSYQANVIYTNNLAEYNNNICGKFL